MAKTLIAFFSRADENYFGGAMRYVKVGNTEIVCGLIREKGYEIGNLDATVIAQRPKLAPYIETMRRTLSETMAIDPDRLNLKATTEERLGFTGREEGIAAHCVCLLE